MRILIIVLLAGFLVGCASSTGRSPRQQAGKPYDPNIPRSPSGCIPVIVSFAGDEWMDADELKFKAKQRLQSDGHSVDDSYECRIHVELIGKGAGCTVEFSKGFGQPIYSVEFDRAGEIRHIEKSIAIEGRPGTP